MPLYEYQCEHCGARFEVIQKYADAPPSTCKVCGGRVQRLASAPAIQFKGSGWYITDYARKGAGAEGEKPASTSADPAAPAASKSSPAAADSAPKAAKPASTETK
jgi:putative FmdB family regulatory protein